jgi:hypothetical protein
MPPLSLQFTVKWAKGFGCLVGDYRYLSMLSFEEKREIALQLVCSDVHNKEV